MRTLHLCTQDDQPYGSTRKCCEKCGLMVAYRDDSWHAEHAVTDSHSLYDNGEHDGETFLRCQDVNSTKGVCDD